MPEELISTSPEVAAALEGGAAVVALETTLVSHGLPVPFNLEVAFELEKVIRQEGAIPATVGMLSGQVVVGCTPTQIELLATAQGVAKLSERDLAIASAKGLHGATTVAATAAVAALVGIPLFATGGIGGVHRGARDSWDVSGDLAALARHPVTVVASGVKSILDAAATLEHLETLGVAVVGYRTRRFPGFYVTDSGEELDWSVDSAAEAAGVISRLRQIGVSGGMLLANPIDPADQLESGEHELALQRALDDLRSAGIRGKQTTPFLLSRFEAATGGRSLQANRQLVLSNARVAAQVACCLAAADHQ